MRTWGRFIGRCTFDGGFLVLLRLAVVHCRLASASCYCDLDLSRLLPTLRGRSTVASGARDDHRRASRSDAQG